MSRRAAAAQRAEAVALSGAAAVLRQLGGACQVAHRLGLFLGFLGRGFRLRLLSLGLGLLLGLLFLLCLLLRLPQSTFAVGCQLQTRPDSRQQRRTFLSSLSFFFFALLSSFSFFLASFSAAFDSCLAALASCLAALASSFFLRFSSFAACERSRSADQRCSATWR